MLRDKSTLLKLKNIVVIIIYSTILVTTRCVLCVFCVHN